MSAIDFSIERVERVLRTIDTLQESEFPYVQSRDALRCVKEVFLQTRAQLLDTKSFADQVDFEMMVQTVCAGSLERIFNYLPLMGFILRSTNVRNAFEVHGPVSRLARTLLQSDTRLLVASEWDYSPQAYSDIPGMDSFIFLGLPSTESSNPLLIPLAGHELGHALWSLKNLNNYYNEELTKSIQHDIDSDETLHRRLFELYDIPDNRTDVWTDIILSSYISTAVTWAVRQSEETFCDFVGLRIFGESFLHAFAYLLSPGEEYRPVEYPGIDIRVSNLLSAAAAFKLSAPDSYQAHFMSTLAPSIGNSDKLQFQLELADRALERQVHGLIDRADRYVAEKGIDLPDDSIIRNINGRFDLTVPAEGSKGLSNILNAGWNAYRDKDLWSDHPHIPHDVRQDRLRELILKNIEILDLEQRGAEAT